MTQELLTYTRIEMHSYIWMIYAMSHLIYNKLDLKHLFIKSVDTGLDRFH